MIQRDGIENERPTCLIVDPARRFGSKRDRLFSDLTARAFWRAGWNVVWMVDHDDTFADRPYADVRRTLPSTPVVVGAGAATPDDDRQLPLEEREVRSSIPERTVNCFYGHERIVYGAAASKDHKLSVTRLDDWARSTWRNSRAIPPRFVALALWTLIRVWYRVQYAMRHGGRRNLLPRLFWRFYEWGGWLQQARIKAFDFLGLRAIRRLRSPEGSDQTAPPGLYEPDFCNLIRQCGPRDVVVLPAAEIVQIEALFGLIARLQLERPLPTTLHVRLTAVERMEVPSGTVGTGNLSARLKSGSPFRSVFMHCDDPERAAHMAQDLGIVVHALDDGSEKTAETFLVRRLSPAASTVVGELCGSDVAPSVAVDTFGPIVLLMSALWGRVGSSTIFDAQTTYLMDRGCIVVRVLLEHYPHYGEERTKRTAELLSQTFDKVRPHLHFIAERRQGFRHLSDLAISSEFRHASPVRRIGLLLADANVEDQLGLSWFAERAAFAVVNHLPHVEFTSRLTKAPLILETHDIYSKLLSTHGVPGFVPPGPDGLDLRLSEEKAVWRKVAACVNLSPEDHEIVEKDAALAVLARPYVARRGLRRRSWLEVLAANRLPDNFRTTSQFDLMVWGSWHDGNVASIRWFLEAAAKEERLKGLKILVVGRVISGLPKNLRRREGLYVTEHVDHLEDFMDRSSVLVIPDQDGTGISIKALDAFAIGNCFASTRAGLRGIDLGDTGYQPSENANELADDIVNLLSSHTAREQRVLVARRLYDLNFSKAAFRSAWDTVLSAVVPDLQLWNQQDVEAGPQPNPPDRLCRAPYSCSQRNR